MADDLQILRMERAVSADTAGQGFRQLLQLRVFRFGFLQNGDVGIGVFPQRKELIVGLSAFVDLTHHFVRSAQAQVRQRHKYRGCIDASVIEQLLKFVRGSFRIPSL